MENEQGKRRKVGPVREDQASPSPTQTQRKSGDRRSFSEINWTGHGQGRNYVLRTRTDPTFNRQPQYYRNEERPERHQKLPRSKEWCWFDEELPKKYSSSPKEFLPNRKYDEGHLEKDMNTPRRVLYVRKSREETEKGNQVPETRNQAGISGGRTPQLKEFETYTVQVQNKSEVVSRSWDWKGSNQSICQSPEKIVCKIPSSSESPLSRNSPAHSSVGQNEKYRSPSQCKNPPSSLSIPSSPYQTPKIAQTPSPKPQMKYSFYGESKDCLFPTTPQNDGQVIHKEFVLLQNQFQARAELSITRCNQSRLETSGNIGVGLGIAYRLLTDMKKTREQFRKRREAQMEVLGVERQDDPSMFLNTTTIDGLVKIP